MFGEEMKNETDGGGNSTNALEDDSNIYLVDFANSTLVREKEFYAVLFAVFLAAALPLALFVAAGIIL